MTAEIIFLPKPKSVCYGEGVFEMCYDTHIVCGEGVEMLPARLLGQSVLQWVGLKLPVVRGKSRRQGDIGLRLDLSLKEQEIRQGDIGLRLDSKMKAQEYVIRVMPEYIMVTGGSGAGLLYGVQTLCQMLEQCGGVLPVVQIRDFPDMEKRGYYLDQTRGRVLKPEELKKVVDRLCRYKINEFQLYVEHTYLFRDFSEMWRDTTPLSAEEIMELDDYCAERHIELVPSLASFGHLYTLLSTKSHEELCELPDAAAQPFSFWDRMAHHTINVADSKALPLIKGMLEEYMALFRSRRFNLCADETFDLGKGRSAELAKEKGVHRIYVDYLKELCEFLVEHDRTPMFWGDVICEEPDLARELPEGTICLTWGYAPDQREDESRKMAETGIEQYLCPGVSGWNQWMNRIGDSYRNITRMCTYAGKYHAAGILNTDWGDYGHINNTDHSVPGLIYGAAFSWNGELIPVEEMNRQISMLEYRDGSGRLVGLLDELADCVCFSWYDTVMFYEGAALGQQEGVPDIRAMEAGGQLSPEHVAETERKLRGLRRELKRTAAGQDSSRRGLLQDLDITVDGILIWNAVGRRVAERESGIRAEQDKNFQLAERLENWFMAYKALWRSASREGDLHHIEEIVFWYADWLRGRERKNRKERKK